jgi:hypothetical protein
MRLGFAWLIALGFAGPAFADLRIENVRATYGPNGPDRASLQTYPGDPFYFAYTVQGISIAKDGIHLTTHLQIKDASGKIKLETTPKALTGFLGLGGTVWHGNSSIRFGDDYAPGEYTFVQIVTDETAQQTVSFERKLELQKAAFALINVQFTLDTDRKVPAPATLVTTQDLYIRLNIVGFDRTAKKLDMLMLVEPFDESGKTLVSVPIQSSLASQDANEVATATSVTLNAKIGLNRAGNYNLKIAVMDRVNLKNLQLLVPIKVVD